MIFVDSNIPMYLVGGPHPHKMDARRLLEQLTSDRERLVTDAEVLQEILHRFTAINRRDAIQPAFDAMLDVIDEVFPIEGADVVRAKELVMAYTKLSARDSIHLAVMKAHKVDRMLSFDLAFDEVPGITRLA